MTSLLALNTEESSCLRAGVLSVFSAHEILFSRVPYISLTSFRWFNVTLSEMSSLTTLCKIAILYSPHSFSICITS